MAKNTIFLYDSDSDETIPTVMRLFRQNSLRGIDCLTQVPHQDVPKDAIKRGLAAFVGKVFDKNN